MTCIVHKYGGSSVAEVDKLKQIARMIAVAKPEADQVAVVVSAMGKTTNNLVNMARSLSADPPRREMNITTLGRGGSDTTALARAAGLDADRCEIYSDSTPICRRFLLSVKALIALTWCCCKP